MRRSLFVLFLLAFSLLTEPAQALRRRPPVECYGREDMSGKWETLEEDKLFVLSEQPGESMIKVIEAATVTRYPISWDVKEGQLSIRYRGEPSQETFDPYQEMMWRSERPRNPPPLPIHFNTDHTQVTLGKTIVLKRFRD
jgi:hypothetical protein